MAHFLRRRTSGIGGMVGVALLFAASAMVEASPATVRNAATFPPDRSQRVIPSAPCSTGTTTVLELGGVTRSKRHNGNDGEAHLSLKRQTDRSVLWKNEYVGEGVCLGFNARSHRHVVALKQEHGIGVRMTDVRYVGERAPRDGPSSFAKRKLEAFVAVAGPDVRHIAFVVVDGNDSALVVLDIEADTLRKLGAAPPPPPLTADERRLLGEVGDSLEGPWGWLSSFRDSYMALDSGIISFPEPGLLRVSYGDDTAERRASNRNVVTWDLRGKQPKKIPPPPQPSTP